MLGLIKGPDNMILRHCRYKLEYWRIRDLPSDKVVIKEDLVSLEEQQGTTPLIPAIYELLPVDSSYLWVTCIIV
jgi:hypothetical protein